MKNIDLFFEYLTKLFPEAKCELNFNSSFEMLIAVMLSAQCTDKIVNQVTKKLFKKYNKPQDFTALKQEELEKFIFSCGLYHSKAKNIIEMSKQLIENYGGNIPHNAKEMEKLKGVGRKTANVVCSYVYNEKVLGVDTHVHRVLNRIGFVCEKTALKTEEAFVKKYKKYVSHNTHYRIVLFGRYICTAKNPKCNQCELKEMCKFYKKINNHGG